VLPLWFAYEAMRLCLSPDERNGAEALLVDSLGRLGWSGLLALRVAFGGLCVLAAWSLLRRQVPWLRVAAVLALEGTVYGLLLGPAAAVLTSSAQRWLVIGPTGNTLAADLVGSLGAGIFEELVFRLGLMSALVWLGVRACRAWSVPPVLVAWASVLVSALVFAWFHHLCGEPYDQLRFLFRTMAGVLLGLLMWGRGYGICVYTHTFYDVHYYLTHP
jgi:membrane protease YdiL (CAAX protease family)